MKRLPVNEISILCDLREQNTGKLISEFVHIGVYKTRPLAKERDQTYYTRLNPPKGRTFTRGHTHKRDGGPFYSPELALLNGQDKLYPHMKIVAFLEYSHDHGVAELSIVKTPEGHIATVTIGDRPAYWTTEKALIADAVFEAEDYIYEHFNNVKRIRNEATGGLHEYD